MIRTVLYSVIVIAAAACVASAQDAPPVFGVWGGATQSRLVGWSSVGPGISNRTGTASFGGYGLVPLNPSWTMQIGASYSQKGWRRLLPGTLDTSVVKVDYFALPVQGRFDLGVTHVVGAFAAG